MRSGVLAAGLVFLVLGVTLFLTPFPPQWTYIGQPASPGAPAVFFEPVGTPAALTFTVSWAALSSSTEVTVYSCGSDTSCSNPDQYEVSSAQVAQGSGSSGSLSFAGSPGTGWEAVASPAGRVSVSYNGPLFGGFPGVVGAGLGVLLLIIGAALKPLTPEQKAARQARRSAAMARRGRAPAAPAPAPPPPAGPAGVGLAYTGPSPTAMPAAGLAGAGDTSMALKVPCRSCGALNASTARSCSGCGATFS